MACTALTQLAQLAGTLFYRRVREAVGPVQRARESGAAGSMPTAVQLLQLLQHLVMEL